MADMGNRRGDILGMTPLYEAMNQLLNESFVTPARSVGSANWFAMDAYEMEQGYVVRLAVPGLKPEQFDITVQQNTLSIRGTVEAEQPENVRWLVRERATGEFSRSVQFPTDVHVDQIAANLEHGILTITLPKAEAARARRITVNSANATNN
jgi:HSP20 family protein